MTLMRFDTVDQSIGRQWPRVEIVDVMNRPGKFVDVGAQKSCRTLVDDLGFPAVRRVMTGLPHAIACIVTSPNGSGH